MFSLSSNPEFGRGTPSWPVVQERLTYESCHGSGDRSKVDWLSSRTGRPRSRVLSNEWFGSMYTRGHLASAGAHKRNNQTLQKTFGMENMLPQEYCSNAGEWYRTEVLSRDLTKWYRNVFTINGGLLLPTCIRTWLLDGHRLEGSQSKNKSYMDLPDQRRKLKLKQWKSGGAWQAPDDKVENESNVDSWNSLLGYINKSLETTVYDLIDKMPNYNKFYSFNGRRDIIETERIAGGQIIPTHFYKIVLATGRRRRPLGDNNWSGQRPPRRMIEGFIIPNTVIPFTLPLRAFAVPISVMERLCGLNLSNVKKRACPWYMRMPFLPNKTESKLNCDLWSQLYGIQFEFWKRKMNAWWREAEKINKRLKNPDVKDSFSSNFERDERKLLKEIDLESRSKRITMNYTLKYSEEHARRLTQCRGQSLIMWAQEHLKSVLPSVFSELLTEMKELEAGEVVDREKVVVSQELLSKLDEPQNVISVDDESTPKLFVNLPFLKGSLPPWLR